LNALPYILSIFTQHNITITFEERSAVKEEDSAEYQDNLPMKVKIKIDNINQSKEFLLDMVLDSLEGSNPIALVFKIEKKVTDEEQFAPYLKDLENFLDYLIKNIKQEKVISQQIE